MSYQDTLQNPNIMINILNEKNEKIDYFMFKNDKYVSLHDKVNKYLEFHITRTIDNNGKLFNKKNKLVFIIQDVRKEIKMEKFKIKIQGIE